MTATLRLWYAVRPLIDGFPPATVTHRARTSISGFLEKAYDARMDTPKRLLDEFPDYVVYLKDEREPTIFKNPAHFFLEPDVIGTPVQDRWVTDADPAKTLTNDVIFRVIPSRADLILQTDAGQFRRSCACACRPRFTHILVDGVPHCPDCRAPWDRQPDAD